MSVVSNNVFDNPPSLSSDEALDRLRHRLTPQEIYCCPTHLARLLDSTPNRDYPVGSIKRYLQGHRCTYCNTWALFVVVD